MHQLVVGGQRSGKSAHAERLASGSGLAVTVIATALAGDDEMAARIARHRAERPAGFLTVEAPLQLAEALIASAAPGRILVIDCLTLWLTNWLMPIGGGGPDEAAWQRERAAVLDALVHLSGPAVFVSNEVGWGVSPMTREARRFVDELGHLNRDVAARCATLTLMVAGRPMNIPT